MQSLFLDEVNLAGGPGLAVSRCVIPMRSDFDIVVRSKESNEIRLICEAKMYSEQVETGEARLKQAMARLSCPLGLLFTPNILRVYADRYTSDNPLDSVELIGEFDSRPLLPSSLASGTRNVEEFESAVQKWLERLPQDFSSTTITDDRLRSILGTFVVPAVASGQVSAAAPRC